MQCKFCKGTGKVLMLYKTVDCECQPQQEHGPTDDDLADMQKQLEAVANDPYATIITSSPF